MYSNYKLNIGKFLSVLFVISLFLFPKYFSIELSASLPIITVQRILMFCLIFFVFGSQNRSRKFFNIIHTVRVKWISVYILSAAISTVFNINSQSINGFLSVIIEQILLFFLMIYICEEVLGVNQVIKLVKKLMFILAILGIFESLFNYNIFNLLYTTSRQLILATTYERMGMLRATGPFGHPLAYSLVIIIIFPLMFYNTRNSKIEIKLYNFLFCILAVNMILTGSRSSMIIFLVQCVLLVNLAKGKSKINNYLFIFLIMLCIIIGLITNSSSNSLGYVSKLFYSISDSLFHTNYISDFGDNADPFLYRNALFKILTNSNINILIGQGANYMVDNVINLTDLYSLNEYTGTLVVKSVDNFYILRVIEYGLVGLTAFLLLVGNLIKKLILDIKISKVCSFSALILVASVGYVTELFAVGDCDTIKFFWFVLAIYYAFKRAERKQTT